jgi:two-component system response regulator FixJ
MHAASLPARSVVSGKPPVVPKGPAVVSVLDEDEAVISQLTEVLQSQQISCRGFRNAEDFFSPKDFVPSCALVDWRFGGSDCFAVANRCRERWPKSAVILTSGLATVPFAVHAMRQGLDGVLQKPINPRELVAEIFAAQARSQARSIISEEQADARRRIQGLRDCELQVLRLLAVGVPNKCIASRLNLATRTVEKYRRLLFDNLGVNSAAEAVRIFVLASIENSN